MTDVDPIPLTVLGGWLGAGKTTLLNRVLSTTTERLAVVVNDVGEINVDADLVRANAGDDDVVELTNGCVCCSIGEDFELTLIELTLRDPAPDRIIVEASGIADPTQIAAFATHRRVVLDAVISLAEADGFTERSSRPPYGTLMRTQIGGADLVIATKLDLVDASLHGVALDELRALTAAPVVAVSDDPAWIRDVVLGTRGPSDRELVAELTHTANVVTTTWRPTASVDADRLRAVLTGSGLLRAKGSVTTDDGPMLVHLAGGRVAVEPRTASLGAVVLIGPDAACVDDVVARLDAD
ncbi:MAG: CobW family GTP-binding protein [Actinomycetota bacterium]